MRNFKGHFSINLLLCYKKLFLICFGLWKPITWILHNNLFLPSRVSTPGHKQTSFYFQLTVWVYRRKENCLFNLSLITRKQWQKGIVIYSWNMRLWPSRLPSSASQLDLWKQTNCFPLSRKYCRFYSLLTPRLQDLGKGRILISRSELDISHSAAVVI